MRSCVHEPTITTSSTVAAIAIADGIEHTNLEKKEKGISISRTNNSFEVA